MQGTASPNDLPNTHQLFGIKSKCRSISISSTMAPSPVPNRVVHITDPNAKLGVRLQPVTNQHIQVTMVAANTLSAHAGVAVGDLLHSIRIPHRGAQPSTVINIKDSHLSYEDLLRLLRETRPLIVEFACAKEDEKSSHFVRVGMTKEERKVMLMKAVEAGDEKTIAALGVGGIPEEIRSSAWKVLLRYYEHCTRAEWPGIRRRHLQLYREYKNEFLGHTRARTGQGGSRRPARLTGQGWWERDEGDDERGKAVESGLEGVVLEGAEVLEGGETCVEIHGNAADVSYGEALRSEELKRDVAHDDPLFSPAKGVASEKGKSRQVDGGRDEEKCDRDLREEIWKDVQRTHPGLHFFTEKTYAGLERILFIFAKLNPGIRYVQGMNEILAPIFYVVMNEKETNAQGNEKETNVVMNEKETEVEEPADVYEEQREADAFFCFCNLMGEIRELFIKELDDDSSSNGLKGRMDAFAKILQRCDPPLSTRLEHLQLKPQYYAIRWFTTLLAREFELPEAVRLWDSLFSDPQRFDFLLYVCCAILQRNRAFVMQNDFATCMKKLQSPPEVDINELLREAYSLAETDARNQAHTNPAKPKQHRYKPAAVTKWIRDSFAMTSSQFHKP